MKKTLLAALIGSLYPKVGAGNLPNIPDNGAMPDQIGLINAVLGMNPFQATAQSSAANTAAFTLTGQQISGGQDTVLFLAGTLGAGAAVTLPTVAALLAALPANIQAAPIGISWLLRVINNGAGAFAWTVTTNTGWTLPTHVAVAQNTWVDYIIQITSLTTATMTSIGSGVSP